MSAFMLWFSVVHLGVCSIASNILRLALVVIRLPAVLWIDLRCLGNPEKTSLRNRAVAEEWEYWKK